MKKGKNGKIGIIIILILTIILISYLFIYIEETEITPRTSIDEAEKDRETHEHIEVDPPQINATKLENHTHQLINKEREQKDLEELDWNSELASVARKHSEYLANREENHGYDHEQDIYINHEGRDGEKHKHRLEKAGIHYFRRSAENVAGIGSVKRINVETKEPVSYMNNTEIAEESVEGWMDSEGHRKNILDPNFTEAGMGIVTDPTETNYIFTQVFIERTECGYLGGECCEERACFEELTCIENKCVEG